MMRIVVIGGGISGLATAYAIQERASRAGRDVELVIAESDPALGGKIKSSRREGYLCEGGPVGFVDNKPLVREWCRRLDLESELVVSNDSYSKRYVLIDGKLQMLPMSPPGFIKTKMIGWPGKLRALMELRTKAADVSKDESIAEFGRRHLGREVADKLIAAMVVGIFAGDSEELSIKSCFPVMLDLEKEGGGSLIKAQIRRQKAKRAKAKAEGAPVEAEGPKSEGMVGSSGKLTTFADGMGRTIDRLRDAFKGNIITGARATALAAVDGRYIIDFAHGETLTADAVVLAVPAYAAAEILSGLDEEMSESIGGIPYVPVNVVLSGYRKDGFGHDLDGFGFLAPKREKRGILGSLWTSSIFDGQTPAGKVALRTMLGGAVNPDVTALDDAGTTELVQKELRDILGVAVDPEFVDIIRHEKAIPQYVVGHAGRLEKIIARADRFPGLFLTGNAYSGVGFNDCVINAEAVGERVVDFIRAGKGAQPKIQPPASSK